MNKQEALKRIETQKEAIIELTGWGVYVYIVELIKSIDEPQKVVVPQFVADWYEKHKDDLEYDIWEYILHWNKQQKSEFYEWMDHANNKPFQTLANMHQFGYEVEKEKRYLVSLKNGQPLVKAPLGGKFYFDQNITTGNYKATRKELEEAGFGWVLSCEGVEVEEVEDDTKI